MNCLESACPYSLSTKPTFSQNSLDKPNDKRFWFPFPSRLDFMSNTGKLLELTLDLTISRAMNHHDLPIKVKGLTRFCIQA